MSEPTGPHPVETAPVEQNDMGQPAEAGWPILCGLETEYGFTVEGHGPEDLVDDAIAFVRAYPGPCFAGWDYRYESPRADLRGFNLERLAVDPVDARFDAGRTHGAPHEVRSDRVLTNGARFYNDHGHPEYSTPECFSTQELILHDRAGEKVLLDAARALETQLDREVRVYKNNTDFHGSSYGTHESYLVPRKLTFETVRDAVLPILIARIVLTGAGKVGSESGRSATFQLSTRADFFVEPINAETLYRRPIFNTRDEPHADPARWMRLHVISGDANRIPTGAFLKVGLVKLALRLAAIGAARKWNFADPVRAAQELSRDESRAYRIDLAGGSWTTAYAILEETLAAAEANLDLDPESRDVIDTARSLLEDLQGPFALAPAKIDWAAKRGLLELVQSEEGTNWRDENLRAYDLEYHNIDPELSLYQGLVETGAAEAGPPEVDVLIRRTDVPERTRAFVRGLAVERFRAHLRNACWRSLVFELDGRQEEVELFPEITYPAHLTDLQNVGEWIEAVRRCTP
jgi:proteasome accessory factor A